MILSLIILIGILIVWLVMLYLKLIYEQQINENIIQDNEELTKENINLIAKIAKIKNNYDFKFDAMVTKKAFTMLNNHGRIEFECPYNYDQFVNLDTKRKINVSLKYAD